MSNRKLIAAVLEAVFGLTGLLAIGVFAWVQFEQHYYQALYLDQLEENAGAVATTDPSEGDLVGRLRADKIGLDLAVVYGSEGPNLRYAAGLVPGSGTNLAIAAHRDSFFRNLGQLAPGDTLELDAQGASHTYEVAWTRIVAPDDVSVLKPTSRPALTLITCYPFRYIGPAPKRYIVRAHRLRQAIGAPSRLSAE